MKNQKFPSTSYRSNSISVPGMLDLLICLLVLSETEESIQSSRGTTAEMTKYFLKNLVIKGMAYSSTRSLSYTKGYYRKGTQNRRRIQWITYSNCPNAFGIFDHACHALMEFSFERITNQVHKLTAGSLSAIVLTPLAFSTMPALMEFSFERITNQVHKLRAQMLERKREIL